jgi:hypothetical protein
VAIHHAKNEPLCETCSVWVRQITAPGPRTDAVVTIEPFSLPAETYWNLAARAHAVGMDSVVDYLVWRAQTVVDDAPPRGVLRNRIDHQIKAALDTTFETDGEIATRLGVVTSHVETLRKNLGIPSARERRTAHYDEKIRKLASDKLSDSEIGHRLGLTKRYVGARRQIRQIPSGYYLRTTGGTMPTRKKTGS